MDLMHKEILEVLDIFRSFLIYTYLPNILEGLILTSALRGLNQ